MSSNYWVTPLSSTLGDEKIDIAEVHDDTGGEWLRRWKRTGFDYVYRSSSNVPIWELARKAALEARSLMESSPDMLVVVSTVFVSGPGPGFMLAEALGLSSDVRIVHIQDACTGFVQALEICEEALSGGGISSALIIVSDEYSRYMTPEQVGLNMLFSDAASATLLSHDPITGNNFSRRWEKLASARSTAFSSQHHLQVNESLLEMNGAAVFQFAASHVPIVLRNLSTQLPNIEDVGKWYVHQGSRIVVETVARQLATAPESLFVAKNYGNVVGSAIPFQLIREPPDVNVQMVGLLAFGMGLTVAASIFQQTPM